MCLPLPQSPLLHDRRLFLRACKKEAAVRAVGQSTTGWHQTKGRPPFHCFQKSSSFPMGPHSPLISPSRPRNLTCEMICSGWPLPLFSGIFRRRLNNYFFHRGYVKQSMVFSGASQNSTKLLQSFTLLLIL